MQLRLPTKVFKTDRLRSKMMLIIAAAAFVSVFSLINCKTLISQAADQRQALKAKRQAVAQLKENIKNAENLAAYYNEVFIGNDPENIIGGANTTDPNAQPPNGDNARVVLNGLPSTYDFPALITSVNKLLRSNGINSPSITSTDESATIDSTPSLNPQPVALKLVVSGTSGYGAVQSLIRDFERSIRPFDITNVQIRGSASSVTVTLAMETYFQSPKSFKVELKERP